jgi:uncharacterized protein (TIGR04255 family)
MTVPPKWAINIKESFEHLPRAPIVEAVIDIQARPSQPLEESAVRSHLEARLDGYAFLHSQRMFRHELKPEGDQPANQTSRDLGWKGVRFRSADEKHLVRFDRDGFGFSRLEPYVGWAQLSDEGLRLWGVYRETAQPLEIHRVGLRFINSIQLPPGELRLEEHIEPAPHAPRDLDLPFQGFLHHDKLVVPGHPYAINLIRTIQPPPSTGGRGVAVIIDIDVFTTQGFDVDETVLVGHLQAMRWLKNKVFFGSVTDKTLESLR